MGGLTSLIVIHNGLIAIQSRMDVPEEKKKEKKERGSQ
jgi:hypothetical protein